MEKFLKKLPGHIKISDDLLYKLYLAQQISKGSPFEIYSLYDRILVLAKEKEMGCGQKRQK